MAASQGATQGLTTAQGVGLAVACAVFLSILGLLGAFDLLDLRLHDWRYRLRGPVTASDRIALVAVDDATLAAFRSWPLPRENYALLIAALEQADAQAAAFDLLFLGNSADDPNGDMLLAAMTSGQQNLVHAITFLPEDPSLLGGSATDPREEAALIRHGRPLTRQRIAAAKRVSLPYPALLQAADAVGHTAVAVDRDGVVRRIPQFIRYGDWVYPSLAIRLVETAARHDSTLPQFELADDGVRLHWQGRRMRVPADHDGASAILFAGDRASFPQTYSMLRVLQWYRDGDSTALSRAFRGKLVLVGTTAVGEVATDVGATPYAEAAPLLYIHANAVNAAVQGRFPSRPPAGLLVPVLCVLAGLLGALFTVLPLARAIVVAVLAVIMIGAADFVMFASADVDLPPTAALFLPPLAWVAVESARRSVLEGRTREREKELKVARAIQKRLLPSGPPETPEVEVFGANEPMEEVGGDYYDWVPIGDDVLAVVVGDVSGHGVGAALLMSHLRASFHAEARPGASPKQIVQAIHASLFRATGDKEFATFFLALVSLREQRLRYCNAGHNPPLLIQDGRMETLGPNGTPLAMLDFMVYEEDERPFARGDLLVMYSDGIVEATYKQEEYDDERWQRTVGDLARRGFSTPELGAALMADFSAFMRGAPADDDVTLVLVRRR